MNKNQRQGFIKITEKMVTPKKVASVFQGAEFLRKLPLSIQKKIMEKGARKSPYISFIVEPYSLFLAYEILDEKAILNMIPDEYELIPCTMFEGDRERKALIIGAFNVHTSVFWGNRLEVYIIAKNKKTGLMSWIIKEYETDTISFDPGRGFISPSTEHSVLTTSFMGEIILDVKGKTSGQEIQVTAELKNAVTKKLDQRLWVEGNFSVDYGNELNEIQTKPFGLIFDPSEMESALFIDQKDVEININTFLKDMIAEKPYQICSFPYAQHFYTTSFPMEQKIMNVEDLENRIKEILQEDNTKRELYSSENLRKPCSGYCYSYACKNGCRLHNKV